MRELTLSGAPFTLRSYQDDSAERILGAGQRRRRQRRVVLPCGAGKTIVGMAAMLKAQCATLILAPTPSPCASGFANCSTGPP